MVFGGGFFDEPKRQRARPRFNDADKQIYYDRQKGKCAGCGEKMPMKVLQMDHKNQPSRREVATSPVTCNCSVGRAMGARATRRKRILRNA